MLKILIGVVLGVFLYHSGAVLVAVQGGEIGRELLGNHRENLVVWAALECDGHTERLPRRQVWRLLLHRTLFGGKLRKSLNDRRITANYSV